MSNTKEHPRISHDELALMARVVEKMGPVYPHTIRRKGDRAYDIEFAGYSYASAWLPLAAIKELTDWTSAEVAGESDHPFLRGDWSGIRDTEEAGIWYLFHKYVRGEVLQECGCCGALHRPGFHGDCRDDGERFDAPINGEYEELIECPHWGESALQGELDSNDRCNQCRDDAAPQPYLPVEYDLTYTGGDYSDQGTVVRIPESLLIEHRHALTTGGDEDQFDATVRAAFTAHTGHDAVHIVSYSNEILQPGDDPLDD